jgi:hypothetical protein
MLSCTSSHDTVAELGSLGSVLLLALCERAVTSHRSLDNKSEVNVTMFDQYQTPGLDVVAHLSHP